jgi:hypothetical protein
MGLQDDVFKTLTLWERLDNTVTVIVTSVTAVLAIFAAFVTWRYDRKRLFNVEVEVEKMKTNFELHCKESDALLERIQHENKEMNDRVIDKIDELKMYLLHSKITIKGSNKE